MVPSWSISAVLALCAPLAEEAPAPAGGARVVGHFRIHRLEEFTSQVLALYGEIGMGGSLYTRQRLELELSRMLPVAGLSGVDQSGVLGCAWLIDPNGSLLAVPFCRLADDRSFEAATQAHSLPEPPYLLQKSGGTVFLPGEPWAEPLNAYLDRIDLFDPFASFDREEATADLSLRVSLGELVARHRAGLDQRISILRGLTLFGMEDSTRSFVRRLVAAIEGGRNLLLQWRSLELELCFEDQGVRISGLIEPMAESPLADWLSGAGPLPAAGLPGLCERPAATLQMGGNTAPLVARLGGGLEDPVLRDLLAGATGELRVSLDVSGAAPCVLLLSACSDPDRLGRLIERAVPAGAAPVLEGESNGIGWAAARAGNRVLLGFGDQPLQAATSALRRIQQPAEDAPGKEEAEAGGPVAVRVELSVSAILSLLRGSAARGGSDPAATPMAPLRIDLWPAGKALRFELIATHASLTDSVPSLELR